MMQISVCFDHSVLPVGSIVIAAHNEALRHVATMYSGRSYICQFASISIPHLPAPPFSSSPATSSYLQNSTAYVVAMWM